MCLSFKAKNILFITVLLSYMRYIRLKKMEYVGATDGILAYHICALSKSWCCW